MSIESSIGDAFEQLQRGRYDSAMTLACTSLDATASNEFGGAVGAPVLALFAAVRSRRQRHVAPDWEQLPLQSLFDEAP